MADGFASWSAEDRHMGDVPDAFVGNDKVSLFKADHQTCVELRCCFQDCEPLSTSIEGTPVELNWSSERSEQNLE